MGASTKFYAPAPLTNFPAGVKSRETQISQELFNIGYYIYTVDGPRVMVDYYSDATGNFMDDADYPYGDASVPARLYMPPFNFVKKDSFGYSTNGQQFVIKQGDSYAGVGDSFEGTTAQILGGTNTSTAQDNNARPLTKVVNTGWIPKTAKVASNILSLWGMGNLGSDSTDVYALSMSYDTAPACRTYALAAGYFHGSFYNATRFNVGAQTQKFVKGPWRADYGLGTYGFDPTTKTAWAVINYISDFAVTCQ
jgi:hypothetical protein